MTPFPLPVDTWLRSSYGQMRLLVNVSALVGKPVLLLGSRLPTVINRRRSAPWFSSRSAVRTLAGDHAAVGGRPRRDRNSSSSGLIPAKFRARSRYSEWARIIDGRSERTASLSGLSLGVLRKPEMKESGL
jgi:hypothetical protein